MVGWAADRWRDGWLDCRYLTAAEIASELKFPRPSAQIYQLWTGQKFLSRLTGSGPSSCGDRQGPAAVKSFFVVLGWLGRFVHRMVDSVFWFRGVERGQQEGVGGD